MSPEQERTIQFWRDHFDKEFDVVFHKHEVNKYKAYAVPMHRCKLTTYDHLFLKDIGIKMEDDIVI